jgi:hypothetical protein
MKSLNLFLPYVLPYAAGCPKPTAKQAIVDAAIEFCEKTLVIQETLDALDTIEDQTEYELRVGRHLAVCMVMRAWFKGQELQPIAQVDLRNVQAYRDDVPDVDVTTGPPSQYFHTRTNHIGLYPIPDSDNAEADALTVRVATRPTRDATQLADELYENWVEAIASGALYRLHLTPDQTYSSGDRAAQRLTEFRQRMNRARIEAPRARVKGLLSVRMRAF